MENRNLGFIPPPPPTNGVRDVGYLYTHSRKSLVNFPHLLPAVCVDKEDFGGQIKPLGRETKVGAWAEVSPLVH